MQVRKRCGMPRLSVRVPCIRITLKHRTMVHDGPQPLRHALQRIGGFCRLRLASTGTAGRALSTTTDTEIQTCHGFELESGQLGFCFALAPVRHGKKRVVAISSALVCHHRACRPSRGTPSSWARITFAATHSARLGRVAQARSKVKQQRPKQSRVKQRENTRVALCARLVQRCSSVKGWNDSTIVLSTCRAHVSFPISRAVLSCLLAQ